MPLTRESGAACFKNYCGTPVDSFNPTDHNWIVHDFYLPGNVSKRTESIVNILKVEFSAPPRRAGSTGPYPVYSNHAVNNGQPFGWPWVGLSSGHRPRHSLLLDAWSASLVAAPCRAPAGIGVAHCLTLKRQKLGRDV